MIKLLLAIALVSLVAVLYLCRGRIRDWIERSPGMVLVLAIVAGTCLGCTSPAMTAIHVADTTAILQEQVAPVLRERCVEPIPRLSDKELEQHRKVCDPAIATYAAVRTAHVALRAALVAYGAATGPAREALVATLIRLAAQLGAEAAKLAQVIEVMK